MRRLFLTLFAIALSLGLALGEAHAKRLGAGRSLGVQRSTLSQPNTVRNAPAAPPAAAAPAQPRRNAWLGPLAGLAAGIGLGALASHFGMGGALLNGLLIGLMVLALVVLVRAVTQLLRRNRATPAAAGAGAARASSIYAPPGAATPSPWSRAESAALPGSVAATAGAAADIDPAQFAQQAQRVFVRLQAANDRGDLADLREFTSPELYAELRSDVDQRAGMAQTTEILHLDSTVLEQGVRGNDQLVSVRFTGSLRERAADAPQALNEVWHFTRPADHSSGWVLAGIEQAA